MNIKTIVQFDDKEVDISNLDTEIKTILKDNKIILKNVEEVTTYVKPEAKYLVVKIKGETNDLEFVLK